MKSLPYASASSGEKAMSEIQRILQCFGCQSFGSMMDWENKKLIVQFRYKDKPVSIEASVNGYAAAWLRKNPYYSRMKKTRHQHEEEALKIASMAVYSILRDWIKGQTTAVECGILSFEGAFLGQILLPNGKTIIQHVQEEQLIAIAPPK